MTRLADEVRPRWWSSAVIVFDVIFPFVEAMALFLSPNSVVLRGDATAPLEQPAATSTTNSLAFQDVARSAGCGNLIAVAVAYIAATTEELKLVVLASQLLIVYLGSLFLVTVLEWIFQGFLDHIDFAFCVIPLCLQLYMQYLAYKIGYFAGNSEEREHLFLVV